MAFVRAPMTILKLKFNPGTSGLDEATAMLDLFGESDGTKVHPKSSKVYWSGNYDADRYRGHEVWTGQMQIMQKTRTGTISRRADRRVQLGVNKQTADGLAGLTYFAYVEDSGYLIVWETASIPYTRFVSYARNVQLRDPKGYTLELHPVLEQRGVRDFIGSFDTIRKVTFSYRHSQSPGSRIVDGIVDSLGVERIKETYIAPKNGSIDKKELLTGDRSSEVVEHLDVNPNNGSVVIEGEANGLDRRVDSRKQVRTIVTYIPARLVDFVNAVLDVFPEALTPPRRPPPPPPPRRGN